MPRVHINIGSNLGDRQHNISSAAERLRLLSTRDFRLSDSVESEPWGFDSDNRFINAGASFETELSPLELLAETQRIEREISGGQPNHRNPDGSYADRIVDLDIIFYGDLAVDSPSLTIPHPRFRQRDFVMRPLAQIDPEWLEKHT